MAHHLVTERPQDMDWKMHGNCRDVHHSVMFPDDSRGVEEAKRVCAGCPVLEECLEYALTYREDHGVWGGASERQRRRLRRQGRSA